LGRNVGYAFFASTRSELTEDNPCKRFVCYGHAVMGGTISDSENCWTGLRSRRSRATLRPRQLETADPEIDWRFDLAY